MDTDTAAKRTPDELEQLKREWLADPCWDIENSEGFEAHHDELVAYRKEWQAKWQAQTNARLEARAEALGCTGNVKLALYVENLEYTLDRFRERIETLEAAAGRF